MPRARRNSSIGFNSVCTAFNTDVAEQMISTRRAKPRRSSSCSGSELQQIVGSSSVVQDEKPQRVVVVRTTTPTASDNMHPSCFTTSSSSSKTTSRNRMKRPTRSRTSPNNNCGGFNSIISMVSRNRKCENIVSESWSDFHKHYHSDTYKYSCNNEKALRKNAVVGGHPEFNRPGRRSSLGGGGGGGASSNETSNNGRSRTTRRRRSLLG